MSDLSKKLFSKLTGERCYKLLSRSMVKDIATTFFQLLYPQVAGKCFLLESDIEMYMNESFLKLKKVLSSLLAPNEVELLLKEFEAELKSISDRLDKDAQAILEGDPAAKSVEEIVLCYPGFYATVIHRLAHFFYKKNVQILPRMLSEYAHEVTGIDIHPGATIGDNFVIDHGTGIVIGESSLIGNSVKIFQGVTLGALSVKKSLAGKKRHPTVEDNSVIYAGATILGGETVIGHDSIIGGNVWITESVPPHSIVYHKSKMKLFSQIKTKKS